MKISRLSIMQSVGMQIKISLSIILKLAHVTILTMLEIFVITVLMVTDVHISAKKLSTQLMTDISYKKKYELKIEFSFSKHLFLNRFKSTIKISKKSLSFYLS